MTFKRRLEFYEINPLDFDFERIFQEIFSKSLEPIDSDGRILNLGSSSIAITQLENSDDYVEGIIMRVTTDDIPLKGSLLRNDFNPIDLAIDEGIADMTYFCYIKELRILCLLPARNGVKWVTTAHYIQMVHDDCKEFGIHPLINPDTQRILNTWRSITSIEGVIKIGNNSRPRSSQTSQLPLSIALDETQRTQATRLKLELYNPKRKGGLIARSIRSLSQTLQRLGGVCETEHINVKGSPSPEVADTMIDLISQKYSLDITLGRGGRYLEFIECQTQINEKITENYEQIKSLIN
ncbi:hypothetical protein HN681_04935 [archaeon]|jgi:hypothetical protein|nr:hypothetical protein [Candidatus Woesearchaeota archaeon]MBT6837683.1 hypothetical protein [Bacteroidota bacterium]MBT7148553.1 hypothetical protein [Candidatus Woesearchaeota archaeon]MBT7380072.1 hypothetical protein [archaeon]MBT8010763.1 hypothetical protein [archaeon]